MVGSPAPQAKADTGLATNSPAGTGACSPYHDRWWVCAALAMDRIWGGEPGFALGLAETDAHSDNTPATTLLAAFPRATASLVAGGVRYPRGSLCRPCGGWLLAWLDLDR